MIENNNMDYTGQKVFLNIEQKAGTIVHSFDNIAALADAHAGYKPGEKYRKEIDYFWYEKYQCDPLGMIVLVDLEHKVGGRAPRILCPVQLLEFIEEKCSCGVDKTGGVHSNYCDKWKLSQ